MTVHKGGCHCGRVRFEVEAPASVEVTECNCSICAMTGYLHLIVPKSDFSLVRGEGDLATYTFNTRTAQHHFCRHCGIKSFYVPRSHPEGISVNLRCIDEGTLENVDFSSFDGRNWEQNIANLSPISD